MKTKTDMLRDNIDELTRNGYIVTIAETKLEFTPEEEEVYAASIGVDPKAIKEAWKEAYYAGWRDGSSGFEDDRELGMLEGWANSYTRKKFIRDDG